MNFTSKGILAAVCLTGSLSIENGPEFVAEDSTFSWLDHHLSFGFSTAYADETEDGDEDPRKEERERCHKDAKDSLDECYADAEEIVFILRPAFQRQCTNTFTRATLTCSMM